MKEERVRMRQYARDGAIGVGWVIAWFAAALIFIAMIWGLVLFAFGLRVATAGIVGRGQAHIQIQSAAFRITAYDHFFNLCAAVQTDEAQLDALRREQATTTEGDRPRVNANITGVTAARAGSINQYNADARKDYTEGQFRDSDLPYQLSIQGEKTSCGSH